MRKLEQLIIKQKYSVFIKNEYSYIKVYRSSFLTFYYVNGSYIDMFCLYFVYGNLKDDNDEEEDEQILIDRPFINFGFSKLNRVKNVFFEELTNKKLINFELSNKRESFDSSSSITINTYIYLNKQQKHENKKFKRKKQSGLSKN